jgi:hypothetical protein
VPDSLRRHGARCSVPTLSIMHGQWSTLTGGGVVCRGIAYGVIAIGAERDINWRDPSTTLRTAQTHGRAHRSPLAAHRIIPSPPLVASIVMHFMPLVDSPLGRAATTATSRPAARNTQHMSCTRISYFGTKLPSIWRLYITAVSTMVNFCRTIALSRNQTPD